MSVLVATAVAGMLAMVIATMMRDAGQSQKNVERGTEYAGLQNTLNLVLSRPDLCRQAFRDASGNEIVYPQYAAPVVPTTIPLDELRFANSTLLKRGARLNSGLEVKDLFFELQMNSTSADPVIDGVNGKRVYGRFVSRAERPGGSQGPRLNYDIETPVELVFAQSAYTTPDGKNVPAGGLLFCSSGQASTAGDDGEAPEVAMCEKLGGVWSDESSACSFANPADNPDAVEFLGRNEQLEPGQEVLSCNYDKGNGKRISKPCDTDYSEHRVNPALNPGTTIVDLMLNTTVSKSKKSPNGVCIFDDKNNRWVRGELQIPKNTAANKSQLNPDPSKQTYCDSVEVANYGEESGTTTLPYLSAKQAPANPGVSITSNKAEDIKADFDADKSQLKDAVTCYKTSKGAPEGQANCDQNFTSAKKPQPVVGFCKYDGTVKKGVPVGWVRKSGAGWTECKGGVELSPP